MPSITVNLLVLTASGGQLWPVSRTTLPMPEGFSPKTAAAAIDTTWGADRLVALVECGWLRTTEGVQLTLVGLLDAIAVPTDAKPIDRQTDAETLAALLLVGAKWRTDPALRQALARFGWPTEILDPRAWL